MQPGVVYTTFHHPGSGANVVTTENSDWATNCPEYKVTAVQLTKVAAPSEWQRQFGDFTEHQHELLPQSAMNPDKLVKMANQIAAFYESEPDRKVAVAAVADHLNQRPPRQADGRRVAREGQRSPRPSLTGWVGRL